MMEDSGSENGCYVNGTRIVNSIVLAPGDEILIGKHHLVLSEAEAEEEAPSEPEKEQKSDVWDASKTYFVAVEDAERHEVLVDYRQLPAEQPPGWPAVKPNERGLSRFVYGFMVDRVRRVSEHVTIGSASRAGRDLGSYFVLCRMD